ncbi:MAG: DNA-binding protein [Pseudomonadota bacterium]
MTQIDKNETYLTDKEVAERWKGVVRIGTLSNWRVKGTGPHYIKIGRSVLYPLSVIVEWEQRHFKKTSGNISH